MEPYITLSFLNDFIFCPRSIYFHQLYGGLNYELYKQKPQIAGEAAHKPIGDKSYSTRKNILQDMEVFSEKYNICGKVDVFDDAAGKLTERKREIKTIYDGYVFQVYA
ncbi:MAG: type V CRISPR-associated protein Cas4, partial [Bacteroidales bacterium]